MQNVWKPLVPPNLSVKYYAVHQDKPLSTYRLGSLTPYKFEMVPTTDYVDTGSHGEVDSLETSSVVALFEGYVEFPSTTNTIYDLCLKVYHYRMSNLYVDDNKIIESREICAQISLEGVKKISIETTGKVELYWRKSSSLVYLPSSEWLKVSGKHNLMF